MGIYNTLNDYHKSIIIKFGEIIYEHLKLNQKSDSEIITILNDDKTINEKLKLSFESGKQISENELNYYKNKVIELDENLSTVKTNLNKEMLETLHMKEQKIESLLENISKSYENGLLEGKNYNKLLLEEKETRLIEKDELIKIYKPKNYENTKQKGDFVENIISDNLVRKIERTAYVSDTSDIKGSGDRIIHYKNFKSMIECKYKSAITISDIEQFKDHYKTDMDDNKYDVAIMISYGCNNILGKGSWNIETYNNKFIGYLGLYSDLNINQKEQAILYFLTFIYDLYNKSNINLDKSDDYEKILIKSTLDIFNDILLIEKQELPYIESINKKYANKKKIFQDYISKLDDNNIPIPLEIQSVNANDELFLDKLSKKIYDSNKIYVPKLNWKQFIIEECALNEFYIKFLNKRGMTRDKILNILNTNYNLNIN